MGPSPSTIRCPACCAEIDLPATGPHSTSALVDNPIAVRWQPDGYRPNPLRPYRTSEAHRRQGLAYYYAHREAILTQGKVDRSRRRAERDARRAELWAHRLPIP